MNLYSAIIKAADHIQANPSEFNFMSASVPDHPDCGTPGCAIGWITYFAGVKDDMHPYAGAFRKTIKLMVQKDDGTIFYDRMSALEREWTRDAKKCASALRCYADKYHGNEKPERNFARDLVRRLERESVKEAAVSEELTW